jgi:diguanylate cyclase (GGDEF)-like protein
VGSKLAYDRQMKDLTEEIQQGNAQFGIVMIDMNSLKYLNDTYGHEKGNQAIIKTCSVICDTFKHSPVYRIGGDEFVVVLKGRDYDNVEELVQQFKHNLDQLEGRPWEKVSAAIGYALYEGEDSADEVFREADHMMYENKKEIKGI